MIKNQHQQSLFLFVFMFGISGFTGLIYESIWTHYLKLYLGHAAYAQSLVLAIFMGGMSAGAWITSRNTIRWRNLVRIYAVIEACIGLLAIIFHKGFTLFLDISYASIIPELGSPDMVNIYKWVTATVLIAPQSILLGMTFPLMAGGVIRRFPEKTGRDIALLYFANSIGAAMGALASGFLFIAWFGLPGTILLAGAMNLGLAIIVWHLSVIPESMPVRRDDAIRKNKISTLFLFGAFVTGAASFIYEIAWIRMLNLALGTTMHAFELMISVFVTGLALGGLWIRNRIDKIKDPISFLGYVQVIMGLMAVMTIGLYNQIFPWIGWLVNNLHGHEHGYLLFNLGSHAIAFLIMLPATFFAGITLPLFTYILMKTHSGERSIGRVYSANTLGAIAGVIFAVHVGLPVLGLKLLIGLGAFLDIGLGLILLRFAIALIPIRRLAFPLFAIVIVAIVIRFVHLDPLRMASGVYRTGIVDIDRSEMIFHKDGKAATISTYSQYGTSIIIATNGKPDASIVLDLNQAPSIDEITMVMMAALPLAMKPDAKRVANIGFGSGLSTHTFLSYPLLETVDSIEIEKTVIEGARAFIPRVYRAYNDPRSHIHIEDAKSWFSQRNEKFDIIVSEPSNPWVSGVGSLFSDEFYHHVQQYLLDDGLFVQWLQLYEFNDYLVGSVLKALENNFQDYAIYITNNSDALIVASKVGDVPELNDAIFQYAGLRYELARVGILGLQDIDVRRVASKKTLSPLFGKLDAHKNSDFYPILEIQAPRARFRRDSATTLHQLSAAPLPVLEMLDEKQYLWRESAVTFSIHPRIANIDQATRLKQLIYGEYNKDILLPDNITVSETLRHDLNNCDKSLIGDMTFNNQLHEVAIATLPYLNKPDLEKLWVEHDWLKCDIFSDQLAIYSAIATRDAGNMMLEAEKQLSRMVDVRNNDLVWRRYLFGTAMLGAAKLRQEDYMLRLWNNFFSDLYPDGNVDVYILAMLGVI